MAYISIYSMTLHPCHTIVTCHTCHTFPTHGLHKHLFRHFVPMSHYCHIPQTSPNTAQQSASPFPLSANSSYRSNHLNWSRFGQVAKSGSTNITKHNTTHCITLPIQCSLSNRFNHLNWSRSGKVALYGQYK